MPLNENIFGTAYLDAEQFRSNAPLFGIGMAFCDYPDTPEGNVKLTLALAAASRLIDAHTTRDFSPSERTEQHIFNPETCRNRLNNPPVLEITGYKIIFAPNVFQTFAPSNVFINNQLGYIELAALTTEFVTISEYLLNDLSFPVCEIKYRTFSDIPQAVKLACGYQAAKMINEGFVDKILPPNFGQLDLEGMVFNNKKGYRLKAEDIEASKLDPSAESLLSAFRSFTVC